MGAPNPDDGLVPEISELYKRNPAEWQKEARKRTRLDATLEKLEQLEASLDGEAAKGSGKHTASQNSKSEEDGKISTETRSVGEAENLVNGRNPKRSKLSSRK